MRLSLLLATTIIVTACGQGRKVKEPLTISIAASLQQPIEALQVLYKSAHPETSLTFNFGASGSLARQIEEGAPADVFISAAAGPMDQLQAKGLVLANSRRDILRNDLVLIAPKDAALPRDFEGLTDATLRLVALGEPRSVPAGEYGKQTLEALRLWDKLQPKLVLAKDVRQVLTYVETGNAEAGIVYSSDARTSGKVRVVATAPPSSHQPIVYPGAALKGSRNQDEARSFLQFVTGPEAAAVFKRYGFEVARQ